MAIRDSERLRQLVGDYYHGLITPGSYREQRAELLDNIGAETSEQAEIATDLPQPAQEKVPITPAPVPADPGVPVASSRPKWLAIGAIAIVGIVAVAYVTLKPAPDIDAAPDRRAEHSGPAPENGSERGDALVEEFLSRNDWTQDSLNNFLLAWGALDEGQRQLASEGRRYRRLTTTLHQRISEETALGRAPGDSRLASLMSFATSMGSPYRESRASSGDRKAGTGVPSIVDASDESKVLSTDSDVTAAALIEDGTAATESAQASMAPTTELNHPVDDVSAQPDMEPSATTETSDMVGDPCPPEIANTRRPYCQDPLTDGHKGPLLVVLPIGSYEMGSDSVESESPAHEVNIAYHIAFSRYEITAQEYEQFCVETSLLCVDQPWEDDSPAVSVSWDDATLYTEWLSDTTGYQYRLPSEAEWEFAARAGTRSPYFFGDEITPSAAHSSGNGLVDSPLSRTDHRINQNRFKLYHMSGNVREWIQDSWHPNYDSAPADGSARLRESEDLRVVRGGSYADSGAKLRSAARESLDRAHRDAMTGIRVVREIRQQAIDK